MSVSDSVIDRTKRLEGFVTHMYLDQRGNVTIGVGHALQNAGTAQLLPLKRNSDSQPASDQEKHDEWSSIKVLPINHSAAYYKPFSFLYLEGTVSDVLLKEDLRYVETQLHNKFSDYDTFPQEAQAALLDMTFNLGITGLMTKFPKFINAVNGHSWDTAADECSRTGVSPDRNTETQQLFRKATSAGGM